MENKQIHNPTRSELITDFVKSNPEYYIKEFQKIGSKPSFSFSFNLYAGILGPIWFGMRNIWNWAQFQIFLIPNQIGPRIPAYKLNENEKEGLLPIF